MRILWFGHTYIIPCLCIAIDYLHNIQWVKRMRHQLKIKTEQMWPRHWKYLTSTMMKRNWDLGFGSKRICNNTFLHLKPCCCINMYCTYCTVIIVSGPTSTFLCSKGRRGSLKNLKSCVTFCVSLRSVLLRLNRQSEPQQRMAAVETDKELNDLLDFTAVRCSNVVVWFLPLLFLNSFNLVFSFSFIISNLKKNKQHSRFNYDRQ